MRLIDANAKITALLYDEEHEETNSVEMTIADFLDSHTVEGCPQNGGWISVKDRLPDECDQYLVCHERNLYLAWCSVSGRWYIEESICEPGYITHWMPLPEPPKEV